MPAPRPARDTWATPLLSAQRHPQPGSDRVPMEVENASYAMSTRLDASYEDAVPRVKEALQAQGFSTPTEIDGPPG